MSRSGPRLKVFFDGGCRPNPGNIEAAVVIRGATHYFGDLGSGTSTDAEWEALLCAVEVARTHGLVEVTLVGDSFEVVTRARAALRENAGDHAYATRFRAQASAVPGLRVRWIKRQQNLAGIALAARHSR